jgi:hypothetical protein
MRGKFSPAFPLEKQGVDKHLAKRALARLVKRLAVQVIEPKAGAADVLAMHAPETKLAQLRAAWAAGDKLAALRIASHFGDRSAATLAFKRGWDAHSNPAFYRQIGRSPEALVAAALAELARKFRLP